MSNVVLNGLGTKDMEKFKNISNDREKIIQQSSSKNMNTKFTINELASYLHPTVQHVKVAEIIKETEDVKTFVLVPDVETETKKLAYFKAGQYISVEVRIGGGIYHRPFTISCSPKLALQNKYTITIKKVPNGIVSNYFFDIVDVGDTFKISAPAGEFCYENLRDANHVIAIAGGSGITPFLSMAEAILDGTLDFQLTILYGAKTSKDLIFKEKLENIVSKTKKVKLVCILSEEVNDKFKTGFIEKDLIDSYLQEENSFFVCGPTALYDHMNEILKNYELEKKYIRHDLFMGEIDLKSTEDYNLTVITHGKEIKMECNGQETILSAIEKSGIVAPSKCHVGECGFCRSRLRRGKVKMIDGSLREADKDYNYIHPCVTFPESDIVIEIPN